MGLSADTLAAIQAALDDVDAYYSRRLAEIDSEVAHLESISTPVDVASQAAADTALAKSVEILATLGVTLAT